MEPNFESDTVYKIVLVGNTNVGKTSISKVYVCPEEQQPNVTSTVGLEMLSTVRTTSRGQRVKVSLWDTAGQDKYRSLGRLYYRGSAGIVFVYDVSDQKSFEDLKGWIEEAKDAVLNWDEVQKIIIGNKSDKDRVVNLERAISTYGCVDNIECFETSAHTASGIQQVQKSISSLVEKISLYKLEHDSNIFGLPLNDRPRMSSITDTQLEGNYHNVDSMRSTEVRRKAESSVFSPLKAQKSRISLQKPKRRSRQHSIIEQQKYYCC